MCGYFQHGRDGLGFGLGLALDTRVGSHACTVGLVLELDLLSIPMAKKVVYVKSAFVAITKITKQ